MKTSSSSDYWTEEERGAFCFWLACNPDAGDVEPGTGGCRKARWGLNGRGKRDGVRVIYFNQREDGELWLLNIYAKNERAALPKNEVKAQKRRAKKTTRRPPTRERDRRPCHDSAQSS